MKHSLLLLATTAVIALSSSSFAEEKKAEPAEKKKDYVIVEVNGDKVKHSEIEKLWQGHFPAGGIEDPIFTGRSVESVLRRLAWGRAEEDRALPFPMDADDNLACVKLCRKQARREAGCGWERGGQA